MIDRIHSQQMIQDREMCCFACSATALVAGLEMMIRPDFDRWRWNVNELRLRKGEENDRQALYQVLAANQMESDHDPGEYLVALIDGTLVGTVDIKRTGL